MRRGLSAVGLVFFILIPLCGFAGERPIVAVFDMEDSSATLQPEVLENLTEYLAVKLAEGGFQVIPRDQVKQRLVAEKKGTYRECFDKSCQIEMGRELAAQKVLSVKILKVAGRCQLTATLFDLKKAATEDAASAEGSCDEESMGQAVLKIAEKLSAKVAPEIPEKPPQEPPQEPPPEPAKIEVSEEATSSYSRWGHITFWTGLGAAAFGTVTGILAYNAGEDFKSGDRDSYDRSVILAGCMYTGLAAGGALIITGIVLWALDPGDNVTSVSALPSADGGLVLTLGGRF